LYKENITVDQSASNEEVKLLISKGYDVCTLDHPNYFDISVLKLESMKNELDDY